MSEYPSTSPWGPHGPQVGANDVTPNPTAQGTNYDWNASAAPNYSAPNYSPRGGRAVSGMPAYVPKPKSIILAILFPLIFGPFGMLYTFVCSHFQKAAMLVLCVLLIYVEFGVNGAHALDIGLVNLTSILLSVVAAVRYNRRF